MSGLHRLEGLLSHAQQPLRAQGLELAASWGRVPPGVSPLIADGVGLDCFNMWCLGRWSRFLSGLADTWDKHIVQHGLHRPDEADGVRHLRWSVLRLGALMGGCHPSDFRRHREDVAAAVLAAAPLAAHLDEIPVVCAMLGDALAHPPAKARKRAARWLVRQMAEGGAP